MMMDSTSFVRVPYDTMVDRFRSILVSVGFEAGKADECASIFATNSLEGIYTHGVNRFPRFIEYAKAGHIKVDAVASRAGGTGALEQWDGHRGPGPINALIATDRAVELARQQGMGCVALANTNHWMRGGTYGWRAARNGCIFIGWSNTTANMPTWGAIDPKLGNNPMVIAVPYNNEAIVLDMAMSQYSFGALDYYIKKNQQLPVPGGYTSAGVLTTDPEEIRDSQRILPIGYWKGAGLSLLLDIVVTLLSGGQSVAGISKQPAETSLSQLFLAIDVTRVADFPAINTAITAILDDYHASVPEGTSKILYPGERVLATREENLSQGIPVMRTLWESIERL
ncbi:3-dehydro-L-gulonate 2-dehydrogenase [Chryseolinea sp. T2]|uniref:3-dehydro-L-gulonate 2-dehydrogenase n=1 Tax=Chryseolinea sp. T2 TaxID=3129255 RepID=UPI0030770562